ncbi:tautomerase family protein [Pseudomonas sp. RHF3.3-3]|uniref:tautomerase family protein n=1 Tax=Pseudomonas sp. RHF3.3-3 TaxID=3396624 RepID=UPI003A87C6FA
MPHVIIKMFAGRSSADKQAITQAVSDALQSTGIAEDSISVAIEDVKPADWTEKVYRPDILSAGDTLFKHPNY